MNSQQLFKTFFAQSLNPTQQQVVSPAQGVLLVCAGAGSGKTRVITARMAHLILEHGIQPQEILALTFTNKAAREMKERITRFLGPSNALPYVGTFHSYCLRLLKTNAHLLPYSQFSLMDDSDQEKLVRGLLNRYGLQKRVAPRAVLSFISKVKNQGGVAQDLWGHDKLLMDLYQYYEQEKAVAHCFDFDDLLLQVLELFASHPVFKDHFQRTVRHVLVDEYQDTNHVQHGLLKHMAQQDKKFALESLCVVGDEDQSIYSWRGATVSNIINFATDFPTTECVTIEQNYRSVQPILHAANNVINHNTFRNPKTLWSQRTASDRIRILSCGSSYQEAEALALLLKLAKEQNTLNQYAILYRSHFQSRVLEEALVRHTVAYKIMGGVQFYDRQEIKDLLAYLRLIINPYDRMAFARAINCPQRGLGDKFEEQFYDLWQHQPLASFVYIAEQLLDNGQLTRTKRESLTQFLLVFQDLTPQTKPLDVLNAIINRTNYFSHLKSMFEGDEATSKRDNVKELINGVAYFQERFESPTLDLFLEEVALLQEHIQAHDQEHDFVRLMTLHGAKGLEFDHVILTGLEDGILPSGHSLYQPENLEEERRLLYVGITRARERLLITHARNRYAYGTMTEQRPSRFLSELPDEAIKRQDCAYWSTVHFVQYFSQWLTATPGAVVLEQKPPMTDFQALPASPSGWQRHQRVTHAQWGAGVIEKIEQRGTTTTYLTIRFKIGIKKLDAQFVE